MRTRYDHRLLPCTPTTSDGRSHHQRSIAPDSFFVSRPPLPPRPPKIYRVPRQQARCDERLIAQPLPGYQYAVAVGRRSSAEDHWLTRHPGGSMHRRLVVIQTKPNSPTTSGVRCQTPLQRARCSNRAFTDYRTLAGSRCWARECQVRHASETCTTSACWLRSTIQRFVSGNQHSEQAVSRCFVLLDRVFFSKSCH